MKRRNPECGKLRRPVKRNKIADGIYGSTFLYLKFLMIWALVLMADFILEFRFEYLWPFWLLVRSVYDSFKYQGLAFSVFFVCIALTSDVICYLYIQNAQWLFFAASTYVWVQYVWQTERGICLPTVSLWLLYIYIEASVRLRELKSDPLPFNLNLCRPFAAHCIGYPVVTLGFGFKSYLSYKMRVRKQRDVGKENEFYIQLLQEALPAEQQQEDTQKALPSKSQEEVISDSLPSTKKTSTKTDVSDTKNKSKFDDIQYIEQSLPKEQHNVNDFEQEANEHNSKNNKANGVVKPSNVKTQKDTYSSSKKGKNNVVKENTANHFVNNKDEVIARLEAECKRLKAEVQSSRNCEQDLRSQINNLVTGDKSIKSEIYQLRQDNESLQTRLHNLVTSRQNDKQTLSQVEKKLSEERKSRMLLEQQLNTEHKAKKAEEAAAARAVVMSNAARDNEIKQLRREAKLAEDQIRQLERETQLLRQNKEAQNDTEVLMSALAAMQDKTSHLENSLSAETRVKLDLFSALGEAKRQIEIQHDLLLKKEQKIANLQHKVAEVMSLLPSHPVTPPLPSESDSPTGCYPNGPFSRHTPTEESQDEDVLSTSNLNPNASDYMPKLN